ncbi:MAG: AbrB family transcriptional regulator [Spirochaetae bacterium HGW-Spirochaetae-7]|jgi:AbrB family looped-hinge helix DNA binding protein|nr:MAG: AbrB family transcriptional regulator [Spirochaetae bacterium HGW-Spirochaetae-7]
MEAVTVSSKYQIVIPKSIRETLGVKPGDKLVMMYYDGGIELVPLREIKDLEGIAPGIDTTVIREPDRQI